MIYLFYGADGEKARAKWRRVIDAFASKNPGGSVFRFDAEHWDAAQFEEVMTGQDLFGAKRLVVGDRLLENDRAAELIAKAAADLAASATALALLEVDPSDKILKILEKAGAKLESHEPKAKASAAGFNPFALGDALAARDRKKLWLTYHQALASGMSEEEIFWKLAWQVKTLLLVQNSKKTPQSLKPFVLQKNTRALKNFKPGELESLSGQLVALWHEARRGRADFDIGLEKLVLSI